MITPRTQENYACGLIVRGDGKNKVIWHNGGSRGFQTSLSFNTDANLTVIVLGNLDGSTPGAIAQDLAAIARGQRVILTSERKEVIVSPRIVEKYVGTYQVNATFSIIIELNNGQLTAQSVIRSKPADQPRMRLYAESETTFFYKAVNSQITFIEDHRGGVCRLYLRKNGVDQVGIRL